MRSDIDIGGIRRGLQAAMDNITAVRHSLAMMGLIETGI
jgi:hypothetical protein